MSGARQQGIHVRIEEPAAGARVARVVIDNERRLNSLNSALMTEFVARMEALAGTEGLRAVVLTGAGDKAFVGGADIDEMAALADADGARAFITRVHRCCDVLRELPVPVIARIQGFTLGAGLELAAACDLRVAADTAQMGMPEVKLGIPSVVEAALLPGLVGWGRAREMLLLGENFGAGDALAWGLVERVVPAPELDAVVDGWIRSLLHTGPESVRLQKQLIRRWENLPMRDAVRAGIDSFAAAWDTGEPARMMGEFQAARQARRNARG
ncbi:MAG TPA: enoyl-CoA hydratase [Quisquiliibacterium sp.]|nr:enoyl-CoA hydratase [Quisquiliibacterium sp.]